jgi:hypothetical protein
VCVADRDGVDNHNNNNNDTSLSLSLSPSLSLSLSLSLSFFLSFFLLFFSLLSSCFSLFLLANFSVLSPRVRVRSGSLRWAGIEPLDGQGLPDEEEK